MNANKALWEKGDFTRIAECVRESGESLVKELDITNGLQVLDLGCGDGTTALPAAQLGAQVPRRSMPGRTSRRWRATSSSAGSRMPSGRAPASAASDGPGKSWRKASVDLAAGRDASIATAQVARNRRCGNRERSLKLLPSGH
jgi:hypothetical protein